MFPELHDLRSNGPITHYPSWEAALAACKARSSRQGESPAATSPLPQGESVEASAALNPLNSEPETLNPPRRGRPKALDRDKQATICNLVAAGVTLRQAAQFVDCSRKSIHREAKRNAQFRRQLAKARSETSIHPLQTLRQAAKANWRAALCWMERLDPERFARPDASVVTQRESNQFVVNLVESIEKTVSDPRERGDLFALLTAVLPAAMRRRWESRHLRGKVEQTKIAEERRRGLERQERDRRRFELFREIGRHLPFELYHKLHANVDLLDPEEVFADGPPSPATAVPARAQNEATANGSSTDSDSTSAVSTTVDSTSPEPTSEGCSRAGLPNNVPAMESFVPPPVRNSVNFAPPPHANRRSANDLRECGGTELPE